MSYVDCAVMVQKENLDQVQVWGNTPQNRAVVTRKGAKIGLSSEGLVAWSVAQCIENNETAMKETNDAYPSHKNEIFDIAARITKMRKEKEYNGAECVVATRVSIIGCGNLFLLARDKYKKYLHSFKETL